MNLNVLRHRLERLNAALGAMGDPGTDSPPVIRAYVAGARDALLRILRDGAQHPRSAPAA
jgi:hypothetical protein